VLSGWENFAVTSGGAAGALTGLLFVAVSLNRDRIVGHAALRSEAGQTLVLFLLALLLSLLLVIPGTSPRLLGIVLVVVAVVSGAILIIIGRGKDDAARGRADKAARIHASEAAEDHTSEAAEARLARLLNAVSPNLVAMLSIAVSGCLEIAGDNGLYWLAAAIVLALGGGVINAWLFLTR
jgi:hypothetical protein